MKRLLVLIFLSLAGSAQAQQQPDPAALQQAVQVLQAQRNQASDAHAAAEVRAVGLAAELAKAQARIREIEAKEQLTEAEKK